MTPLSNEFLAELETLLAPEADIPGGAEVIITLRQGLRQAVERDEVEALARHLESLPRPAGIHVARAYLESGIAVARNDLAEADLILQPLCEKLNQAEAWPLLVLVAMDWLEGTGNAHAARYLVRCWKQGGPSIASEAVLRRAHELFPRDVEVSWCLGITLEDRGSTRESRRLLAAALKPLADERDLARVEEGVLRLIEAPEASVVLGALEAIDALAHRGEGRAAASLFEMLQPALISHQLAGPAWQTARRALERQPKDTAWRPLAIQALRVARSDLESLERVIEVSGLDRLAVPPAEALATLDRVLPYAPGFYVEHSGWGLGEIRDNDGEFLTISFPGRPNHRMNLKAATQALTSLPADDLKVLLAVDKPRLLGLAADDPVGLVAIALKRAGGEAPVVEIRKLLVPAVIGTTEWSGWWKKARELLAADSRVDSRHAFRDVYSLPIPGISDEEEIELPPIDEPRGVDHNIDLIHQFLEHHPGAAERLEAGLIDRVQRWAERRTAGATERARAQLLLHRWDPGRRAEHEAALCSLFLEPRFDLSAAGSVEEQLQIFEIGLAGDTRAAALRQGLNGRSGPLRERAILALWSMPDEEPVSFAAGILAEPVDNTDALFLITEQVAGRPGHGDPRLDDLLWPVVLGLIDLLNVTGREPIRKKGLKLLDANGPLMERVRALPPDERTELTLTARLRDWRSSDKILFPILEAFAGAGLATVAASVNEKRAAAHARLFRAAPAPDDIQSGPVIMSRHTFETLHAELERINLELKTSIPQAIRKARELGDLRENAEYEAAKLKQANASKRLAQLDSQLGRVRILEDMPLEEGVAGPGTVVAVRDEDSGSSAAYWILGEGDHDYGDDVISYRAPLGRALTGRRPGDLVEYAAGETTRRLRIGSVSIKRPEGPPADRGRTATD